LSALPAERTRDTPAAAEPAADADVRLEGLRKLYGDVVAVDGVDLEVGRGEFFTMLGPSGSGKTTTLRLIAGFERPDAGSVRLRGGGRPSTSRRPRPTSAPTRGRPSAT